MKPVGGRSVVTPLFLSGQTALLVGTRSPRSEPTVLERERESGESIDAVFAGTPSGITRVLV